MAESGITRECHTLPILCVKGTHYQIGYQIGSTFKDKIHRYWENSKDPLLKFYDTKNGRQMYDNCLKVTRQCFPQYIREIEGMAEGAQAHFENLFLLHLEVEIFILLECLPNVSARVGDTGCSIVLLNGKKVKLLGHNEDNFPLMKETAYLIQADILDEDFKSHEKFTSYAYPGRIPGYSFTFNHHGVCFAINTLVPEDICQTGCPQALICRSLCSVKDLKECVKVLRNDGYGCNSGFCVNLAHTKVPSTMWSIEVAPGEKMTQLNVRTVDEGDEEPTYYVHVNNYRHMDVKEQVLTQNMERLKRLLEMKIPTSLQDIKAILGDRENPRGHIYRTDKNAAETVASAVFDIIDGKCHVFLENPAKCVTPVITLLM